jgi:hypothetical protein
MVANLQPSLIEAGEPAPAEAIEGTDAADASAGARAADLAESAGADPEAVPAGSDEPVTGEAPSASQPANA